MNCPQCGEVCRCSPESSSAAWWQRMSDAENHAAPSVALSAEQSPDVSSSQPADAPYTAGEGPDAGDAWRGELVARLNRYRSRRKPVPPRYPSLRLRFDDPPSGVNAFESAVSPSTAFETASNQSLALAELTEATSVPARAEVRATAAASASSSAPVASRVAPVSQAGAKVIEFPRFNTVTPPPSLDELADPVIDRPRILEAPEVAPPPPALGGITMEAAEQKEVEKRPGIDIPLQSAPLARRVVATVIDGLIIAAASVLFGFIFWKVTTVRPPRYQMLELAAAMPCLFWAAYQYLLIVYSASTPGLRLAGLELVRFDGQATNRCQRRWRVLTSYLSGVSLGMGYAWVFLDEDALCWHDRITHTYLAPRRRAASASGD